MSRAGNLFLPLLLPLREGARTGANGRQFDHPGNADGPAGTAHSRADDVPSDGLARQVLVISREAPSTRQRVV